jgi:hypothetical protein
MLSWKSFIHKPLKSLSRLCLPAFCGSDKGPILQNSIFGRKTFSDKIFTLKFWTRFHPKPTFLNLSEYYEQKSLILSI